MTQGRAVPSYAEVLAHLAAPDYSPATAEELSRVWETGPDAVHRMRKMLKRLQYRNEIIRVRGDRFALSPEVSLVEGEVKAVQKGWVLVRPAGEGPDLPIPERHRGGALPGDTVRARTVHQARAHVMEAQVAEVLRRGRDTVTGLYRAARAHGWVDSKEKWFPTSLYVPEGQGAGARDGQMVVARITSWPSPERSAEGQVTEIIGFPEDKGNDVLFIIRQKRLPEAFPEAVLAAAAQVPQTVPAEACAGRLDLRGRCVFTLDTAGARDLDDAVSLEERPDGLWRLGVHIADVSHYVAEGSALDKEAYTRATSVYLVDRVLPMLPPALSNGICSLNPGVDRLTMSVFMDIDPETGRMAPVTLDHFALSVIRTRTGFFYPEVTAALEDAEHPLWRQRPEEMAVLERMDALASLLRSLRLKRGSLDFDLPETKVILDDEGHAVDITRRRRTRASGLIEEFMISANEAVAGYLTERHLPCLYRIHEDPGLEKLTLFNQLVDRLGYKVRNLSHITPRSLQKILDETADRPEAGLVHRLMLRAMKQAVYSEENQGHFGLASPCYLHFTSPIRRYPDLLVHRILRGALARRGDLPKRDIDRWRRLLGPAAAHCSAQERVAMEAEFDSVDLKKAEFLKDRLGETFHGVITGVQNFGLFVEVEEYPVEGLIPIGTLPKDYYVLDERAGHLIGERTRTLFQLGDPVVVQLVKVDMERRHVDFWLVQKPEIGVKAKRKDAGPKGRRRGRRG